MNDRKFILNARIPLHDRLKLLLDRIEAVEAKLSILVDNPICYFQWYCEDGSTCITQKHDSIRLCPACKITIAIKDLQTTTTKK